MPQPEKYPLKSMVVGQVIHVPETPVMSKYIHKRGEKLGMVFRTKRVGEQRKVWRVV